MSKCPYCKEDLRIEDFFERSIKETKDGKIKAKLRGFGGENIEIGRVGFKMWSCPGCDTILGFSEYRF